MSDRVESAHHLVDDHLAMMHGADSSDLFSETMLWVALGSLLASAASQLNGTPRPRLRAGRWSPAPLLLAVLRRVVRRLSAAKVGRDLPSRV